MDAVLNEQSEQKINARYSQEAILGKLNDLGIKNDEQFNELLNKFKFLFAGKTFEGNIKYPKCANDLHKDLVYYDKDISRNKDLFNEEVRANKLTYRYDEDDNKVESDSNPIIFKLCYNEVYINTLREHINVVNSIRANTETAFQNDVNNKHFNVLSSQDSKAVNAVTDAFDASGVDLVKKVKSGISTAKAVGITLESEIMHSNTAKIDKFRSTRANTGVDSRGIYNQYNLVRVDSNMLNLNNSDTSLDIALAYNTDIRLFVVNSCGCMVKRGVLAERNNVSETYNSNTNSYCYVTLSSNKLRSKPYNPYVKNSLAITPIEHDERLFNFYCQFFIAKYVDINTSLQDINFYSASYTGLDSYKAYMDLFINAYFAAKKSLLSEGSVLLNILNNMDYKLISNSDIALYGQFLWRVKLGLVIQGVRMEKAEYFVRQFMKYDSTLKLYMSTVITIDSTNFNMV